MKLSPTMTQTQTTPATPIRTFAGQSVYAAKDVVGAWGTCMAIYGPGGVGKTTLVGRAAGKPHIGKLLVLDAEGGSRVISHLPNIEVMAIDKWDQILAAGNALYEEEHDFGSVMLDNMSEYGSLAMNKIIKPGNIPEIQHWGKMTAEMLAVTRSFRDLTRLRGINVFYIAWDTSEIDEETKVRKRRVNFNPALQDRFPGIVDIVGYLSCLDNPPTYTRVLNFSENPRLDSKFRRNEGEAAMQIPKLIANPDLATIVATLKGGEPFDASKHALPTKGS